METEVKNGKYKVLACSGTHGTVKDMVEDSFDSFDDAIKAYVKGCALYKHAIIYDVESNEILRQFAVTGAGYPVIK